MKAMVPIVEMGRAPLCSCEEPGREARRRSRCAVSLDEPICGIKAMIAVMLERPKRSIEKTTSVFSMGGSLDAVSTDL